MALFKPVQTTGSNLPNASVVDGQFVVATDRGEAYVDTPSGRVRIADVITGTYSSITSNLAPLLNKLYFATDTHQLLQAVSHNNSLAWVRVGLTETTSEVTLTATTISQAIANNTIYTCSNPVSSLTVVADDNLLYASMNLTTGSSGMAFNMPGSGWVCTGSDCASGVWSPAVSKQYCLAFEKINSSLVIVSVYRVGSSSINGVSPTVSIGTKSNGSQTITITDNNGDHDFTVEDGKTSWDEGSLVNGSNTLTDCASLYSSTEMSSVSLTTGASWSLGNTARVGITFSSSASFSYPSNWICVGDDCSDGDFTFSQGERYWLTIENRPDATWLFALRVPSSGE